MFAAGYAVEDKCIEVLAAWLGLQLQECTTRSYSGLVPSGLQVIKVGPMVDDINPALPMLRLNKEYRNIPYFPHLRGLIKVMQDLYHQPYDSPSQTKSTSGFHRRDKTPACPETWTLSSERNYVQKCIPAVNF